MCHWLSNCVLGGYICANASILYIMLLTTPIWLHLWCQRCPMCQASRDWSAVFPVPDWGWGALMANGRNVNCPEKTGLLFCSWQLLPTTALQEADYMHFKICLSYRNKIQYRIWQNKKLYFLSRQKIWWLKNPHGSPEPTWPSALRTSNQVGSGDPLVRGYTTQRSANILIFKLLPWCTESTVNFSWVRSLNFF